jgi:type VI secretion system protein ImpF
MSSFVQSSFVPFFDLLCGSKLDLNNKSNLDARAFQDSLLLDLSRLFNSRCDLTYDEYLKSTENVLHYGIPSFTDFSPISKKDHIRLEILLNHAIKLFEPRMTRVKVMVSNEANDNKSVKVEILSAVNFGNQMLRFVPSYNLNPNHSEVVIKPEND